MEFNMVWKPRVVVAAVLERDGKYLVVEEKVDNENVINQPAGHLEANETIIDAVKRETLEETGWKFEPTHIVGIMHLLNEDTKRIFIRFTFTGNLIEKVPGYKLDPDILGTKWMSYNEIKSQHKNAWRSPLVMRSLDEYRAGKRYPMDIIHTLHVDDQPCLTESKQQTAQTTKNGQSSVSLSEFQEA
jgi:ADP-ribose pyrophosphatase YjhB (NUDIX family)